MKINLLKTGAIVVISIVSLTIISCKKKGCIDPIAVNYNPDAEKEDSTCTYEEHDHHDEIATATIHITSINEGDSITQGAMTMVHGAITGKGMLHGYDVKIDNITNGTQALFFEEGMHSMSYSFNQHWTNNVAALSNMKATVVVYFDHDHTLSDSSVVNFVCQP